MKIDAAKLDLHLARAGLSLSALRGGTSPHTLARIRRGAEVTPRTVGRIANALHCDPSEIIAQKEAGI